MSEQQIANLATAVSQMLEQLRPGSMQAKVLEAMVNKPGNPRMTYDLDTANKNYAEKMEDLVVPSVWELIALDIAPYPGFWHRMEYARDNAKAVRSAVYALKEHFETLGDYQDEDGNQIGVPISLFIFNKRGLNSRDINVVTPIPDYCNAAELCRGKARKGIHSRIVKMTSRERIAGKDENMIIRELVEVFSDSMKNADLDKPFVKELKRMKRVKG